MPRKKKTEQGEPISVSQSDLELEPLTEPDIEPIHEPTEKPIDKPVGGESFSRDYMTASLQLAQASMTDLFEAQAQLAGIELADKVFDVLEESFVTHLQQRLQPFVDTLLPEIRESHTQIKERTTARLERRQGVLDRLKQIATLVTDECRLSLPNNEPTGNLLGFASWEPVEQKENEHE